jgi:hypothetical protein
VSKLNGVSSFRYYGNGRIVEDPNTCRTLWMVERCDVYVTMSSHSVVDEVRIQRAMNSSMTGLKSIGKVVKSRFVDVGQRADYEMVWKQNVLAYLDYSINGARSITLFVY